MLILHFRRQILDIEIYADFDALDCRSSLRDKVYIKQHRFNKLDNYIIIVMSENKTIKAEVCEELRTKRRNGFTYKDLDEEYTLLSIDEIIQHIVGVCECENETDHIESKDDEPWREKYVVEKLYIDEEKRFTEMAEIMDCHSETARKYVDKFDISMIDSSNRTSSPRVNKLQRMGKNNDVDIGKE